MIVITKYALKYGCEIILMDICILLIYQYSILWYICIAQMYGSVQRECYPDMKSINRRYTYKCYAQMDGELARKCFFVIDISIVVGLIILCNISNAYLTPPLLFFEFLVTDFVQIFYVSHAVSQNFILVLNLVGILYTSGEVMVDREASKPVSIITAN